jgi:hypothetical protein
MGVPRWGDAPRSIGRRSRRQDVLAVVATALVLVLAVVLLFNSPYRRANAGARAITPAATPSTTVAAEPPGVPVPGTAAADSSPTAAPQSPPPTNAPNTGPGGFTLPAGWVYHNDPTGFRVAYPEGWRITRDGSMVYFRDPGGGRVLGIDQTDQPKADPVADWQSQERNRVNAGDFPGYTRIRIEAVAFWSACADWEFTYTDRGSSNRLHVINRGFITSPRQAYAIFWLTRDFDWGTNLANFNLIAASFRPAGE